MKSTSDRLVGISVAGAIVARAQDVVPDRPVLTRAFSLPAVGARELRLDLFRGLALWLIFIDHVSPDLLSWFTIRSYGFSDAAEIFIFISGYTAALVYGRSLLESGFVIASARILRRVWQIYAAHILLFTIMVAEVSYVGISLDKPFYAEEVALAIQGRWRMKSGPGAGSAILASSSRWKEEEAVSVMSLAYSILRFTHSFDV
jgi:hypothetical protein